jgi:CheY-like chemotaxis protein
MMKPLTLVCYERVLPGGQLVNRLQDLGYRVQASSDPASLEEHAEREKPILVMVDLEARAGQVCEAIGRLKRNQATAHIPVIAFGAADDRAAQDSVRAAGAKLVVQDAALLAHLDQFLDQALQVE